MVISDRNAAVYNRDRANTGTQSWLISSGEAGRWKTPFQTRTNTNSMAQQGLVGGCIFMALKFLALIKSVVRSETMPCLFLRVVSNGPILVRLLRQKGVGIHYNRVFSTSGSCLYLKSLFQSSCFSALLAYSALTTALAEGLQAAQSSLPAWISGTSASPGDQELRLARQ